MSDSDLMFSDEPHDDDVPESEGSSGTSEAWRILVVDDEEQVHKITTLVLQNCDFDGRGVEMAHAYSMAEAKEMVKNEEPFALALVDVVMETDDAGLRLVQHIREDLEDHDIRIVLRTGQPGQAPEETVIHKYDINDYKNKTELTSTKLKTLLFSTLRSYRDIQTIKRNRQGLYRLIEATSKIVDKDQLAKFSSTVLEEVSTLLNLGDEAICAHALDALAATSKQKHYQILAATGKFKEQMDHHLELPEEVVKCFTQARDQKASYYDEDAYVGYYQTPQAGENFLYVKPQALLDRMDIHLLDMYVRCVAITHHNLKQKEVIHKSRQEMVYVLSETIEQRRPNEANHVRRVSLISQRLAEAAGLTPIMCERIKLASALHDIGTIALEDTLLECKDIFTDEQRDVMQTHSAIGEAILGRSKRPVLILASVIAGQHHEHWDGQGYPNGLKGEDIDIAARIVGIADCIDAMSTDRAYRKAFTDDEIKQFIAEQLGKQFDPKLGQLTLDVLPDLFAIRDGLPDAA